MSSIYSGHIYREDNEASYAGGKTVEVLGGVLYRFSFFTARMLYWTKLPGSCVKEASFVEDEIVFVTFKTEVCICLFSITTLLI